jgi:hypothetical protein
MFGGFGLKDLVVLMFVAFGFLGFVIVQLVCDELLGH